MMGLAADLSAPSTMPAHAASYALESSMTNTTAPPNEYYFYQDGKYYLAKNNESSQLESCPESQWVLKEDGWKTNRRGEILRWRKRVEREHTYQ